MATVQIARSFRVAGGFVPAYVVARAAFFAAPVHPAAAALPTPFFSLSGVEHQRFAFVAIRFVRAITHSAGHKTYPVATKLVV